MLAGKYDITIEKGATFNRIITYKDENGDAIDLTGFTAAMDIRAMKTTDTTLIQLTTENGRIALGDAAGTITLTILATDTETLGDSEGVTVGFYDLELITGSTVIRLLEGEVQISKEVTR